MSHPVQGAARMVEDMELQECCTAPGFVSTRSDTAQSALESCLIAWAL